VAGFGWPEESVMVTLAPSQVTPDALEERVVKPEPKIVIQLDGAITPLAAAE
jgi:hypothetical protein